MTQPMDRRGRRVRACALARLTYMKNELFKSRLSMTRAARLRRPWRVAHAAVPCAAVLALAAPAAAQVPAAPPPAPPTAPAPPPQVQPLPPAAVSPAEPA